MNTSPFGTARIALITSSGRSPKPKGSAKTNRPSHRRASVRSGRTASANAPAPARRPSWGAAEVANPLSRYPHLKRHRSRWYARWGPVGCKVTAADGTWGLGVTTHGRPVAAVIDDHFAPHLT